MIAIKQNLQLLTNRCSFIRLTTATSVTSKKLPNVNKSCQKTISLENWKILTPLQKLPKNVENLGKTIGATDFEKLPKVQ